MRGGARSYSSSYSSRYAGSGGITQGAPRLLVGLAFVVAAGMGWSTGKLLSGRVEESAAAEIREADTAPDDSPRYSLGDTVAIPRPVSIFDSGEWVREDGLLVGERPPLEEAGEMIVRHLYRRSFGKQFELESVMLNADLLRPGTFFEVGFSGDKQGTHFLRVSNRAIDLIYGLSKGDERVVLHSLPADQDLAGKDLEIVFGDDGARALLAGSELGFFPAEEARRGLLSAVTNLGSTEIESLVIAGIVNGAPVKDVCK